MRWPVSVAGGTVIDTRFSVRTSPAPRQVGHGCEGILPRPRHWGQGRFTAKPPWPNEIVPRPLHSGQVDQVAPGAPPLPPQVGQASVTGMVTVIFPPSAATRNGTSTTASTVSTCGSAWRPPRPKMDEKMSPRPPKSPKSKPSLPTSPGAPAPRAAGARAPRPTVERAQPPHLVVLLPLLGVREHAVGFRDLLETLGGRRVVGVGVRMILLGEAPIRLLDVALTGRLGNAEDLIEVLRCHWSGLALRGVHLHPRGAHQIALEPVARLERRAHGVVELRLGRWDGGDRLVDDWDRTADRPDRCARRRRPPAPSAASDPPAPTACRSDSAEAALPSALRRSMSSSTSSRRVTSDAWARSLCSTRSRDTRLR